MTLFISVINHSASKIRLIRSIFAYLSISVFLFVFNLIYTHFSFGESSIYMQRMFLIPFAGLLPALIALFLKKEESVTRLGFNLWNSGLACFITGCLLKGIVHISGRFTSADLPYWYAGATFLILAIVVIVIHSLCTDNMLVKKPRKE